MRRLRLLATALAAAALLAITAGSAAADGASHSYLLVAEEANIGVAANGETIHISCESTEGECGTFAVNPKAIEASGEFQHFGADGSLLAEGTWTATQLISYQSYGCGEVFGQPIPPDLCGGAVRVPPPLSQPPGGGRKHLRPAELSRVAGGTSHRGRSAGPTHRAAHAISRRRPFR